MRVDFLCGIKQNSRKKLVRKTIDTVDSDRFDHRAAKLFNMLEDKKPAVKILTYIQDYQRAYLTDFNTHKVRIQNILKLLENAVTITKLTPILELAHECINSIISSAGDRVEDDICLDISRTLYAYLDVIKSKKCERNFSGMIAFTCQQIIVKPTEGNIDSKKFCIDGLAYIVGFQTQSSSNENYKDYKLIVVTLIECAFLQYEYGQFPEKLAAISQKAMQAVGLILRENVLSASKQPATLLIVKTIVDNMPMVMNALFVEEFFKQILDSLSKKRKIELISSYLKEASPAMRNKFTKTSIEIIRRSEKFIPMLKDSVPDSVFEISNEAAYNFAEITHTARQLASESLSESLQTDFGTVSREAQKIYMNLLTKESISASHALSMLQSAIRSNLNSKTGEFDTFLEHCVMTNDSIGYESEEMFLNKVLVDTVLSEIIMPTFSLESHLKLMEYILKVCDRFKIVRKYVKQKSFEPLQWEQIKKKMDVANLEQIKLDGNILLHDNNLDLLKSLLCCPIDSVEHLNYVYCIFLAYGIHLSQETELIMDYLLFTLRLQHAIRQHPDATQKHKAYGLHITMNVMSFCSSILNIEDLTFYIGDIVTKNTQAHLGDAEHTFNIEDWICVADAEIQTYMGSFSSRAFNHIFSTAFESLSKRASNVHPVIQMNPLQSARMPSANDALDSVEVVDNSDDDGDDPSIKSETQSFDDLNNQINKTHGATVTQIYKNLQSRKMASKEKVDIACLDAFDD